MAPSPKSHSQDTMFFVVMLLTVVSVNAVVRPKHEESVLKPGENSGRKVMLSVAVHPVTLSWTERKCCPMPTSMEVAVELLLHLRAKSPLPPETAGSSVTRVLQSNGKPVPKSNWGAFTYN